MLAQFWAHLVIPGASIVGIIFAIMLWLKVSKISVAGNTGDDNREYLLEEQRGDAEVRNLTLSSRLVALMKCVKLEVARCVPCACSICQRCRCPGPEAALCRLALERRRHPCPVETTPDV